MGEKDIIPIGVLFHGLRGDPAFKLLEKRALKIIADEKDKHYKMPEDTEDERNKSRTQKIKARAFEEFWEILQVYVVNSALTKNKPKVKRKQFQLRRTHV